jgi:hypothetical protein
MITFLVGRMPLTSKKCYDSNNNNLNTFLVNFMQIFICKIVIQLVFSAIIMIPSLPKYERFLYHEIIKVIF